MSLTQREAYAKFRRENHDVRVGKRTFDIKQTTTGKACLCVPCQNILRKAEVLQNLSKTDVRIPKLSKQEIIDLTVCDNGQKNYAKSECLTGSCTKCGFNKVSNNYIGLDSITMVEWEHWEYANIEIDNLVKVVISGKYINLNKITKI